MKNPRTIPGHATFRKYDGRVKLTLELDREDDGRWIADVFELPGVTCYGQHQEEAIRNAKRLAIAAIADRIAHGELLPAPEVSFTGPDGHDLLRHSELDSLA